MIMHVVFIVKEQATRLTPLFEHDGDVFIVLVVRCKLAAQFVGGAMFSEVVAHTITALLHCPCSVVFSPFDKQ
jgi:hypothetical protein